MRQLRLHRHGRFEDSKPSMGLTLVDGKYKADILLLSKNKGKEYNMYIASSGDSLYLVDAEKNEIVLKNDWKLGETYSMSDCLYGDNFHITIKFILGSDELTTITYKYDDFVNLVFGVSENCKTIEEAKHYLEEHGSHISLDSPNLYISAPVYPDFIHLNVHSHYSIMKSQITIPAAVDKAVADGMKGMALTDLGVMYGIKEFVDYCAKINKERATEGLEPFKPIIGCEMYVAPRTIHDKEKSDDECGHLIVLAKNLTGYKNLCKLVSNSWIEGLMDEMPRTDHAELEKYKDDLIVIASGMNSEIANHAIAGNMEKALSVGEWYKITFGDDFYIGIHGDRRLANYEAGGIQDDAEREKVVWPAYAKVICKYDVQPVCVNSCNYLNKEDGAALDHLLAIANNTTLDDAACPRHTEGEWMKTRKELKELFRGQSLAESNSLKLFDKIEFYSIDHAPLMPVFAIPEGFASEADYLAHFAYQGAKERYGEILPENVKERLDYELDVINGMGYPGYFLIVADMINAARNEMGVWVGPGRGSAAGSIVAYCLGITKIDPIKHGLLFERFLNPDRVSLPDIDTDFDDEGRGRVMQWIRNKYGEENVAHIITYGVLAVKSAIQTCAKTLGAPNDLAKELCDAIPYQLSNDLKMTLPNAIASIPKLKAIAAEEGSLAKKVLDAAVKVEGRIRARGIHACGIIISPTPISEVVPVCTSDDPDFPDTKTSVTQYDGHYIESTGLIKMDLLGLKTLSELKEACKNVKLTHGIDIDLDTIPVDDEETYELYQKGQTIGTFQFESAGMRKYLQELHPTVFGDLVAMNALYRPGPFDYIPKFIARKNGQESITYDLPCMEKYLKETYGVTVYQEQVMLLSRELAGFTRGQSDALRKAIGRKNTDFLNAIKPTFIEGGVKNGHPQDTLEKIWADWLEFGKYAFNKSHAVAYTWLAYQTAYLKANYPSEFMAALLTRRSHDAKEVKKLLEECKAMGIKILPPSVNASGDAFTSDKDNNIHFGLCAISGIGQNVVAEIMHKRSSDAPYKDIFDFAQRINRNVCNKRVFERLALCGAFDCFGLPREQYLGITSKGKSSIDLIFDFAQSDNGLSLFPLDPPELPVAEDIPLMDKRTKERELMGISFIPHPIEAYQDVVAQYCNVDCELLNNLVSYKFDTKVQANVAGLVTIIRTGVSKNNKEYGVIAIEDENDSTEIAFFGMAWQKNKDLLDVNKLVLITGNCEEYNGRSRFSPNKVYDLESLKEEENCTTSEEECSASAAEEYIICPHCCAKMDKVDHYCYYHWDGGEWSDLRHEAPQVMVPSIVQHCPHCGNYFAMNKEFMMISDTSKINFIDPVDFPSLIHSAFKYCMPTSEFKWDSPTQEFNQRMRFLWAYNDYFYRNSSEHPEPEEMAKLMHRHNVMELLKFFENPLIQCDFLRQAGDFNECVSQINALMNSAPEVVVPKLNLLKQKAIAKDCAPFKIDEPHNSNEEPIQNHNNKGEESSVDDEVDLPF